VLVLSEGYVSDSAAGHVVEKIGGCFSGAQSPFQQMSAYELKSDAGCVGHFAYGRDRPAGMREGNVYCWPNSFGLLLGK